MTSLEAVLAVGFGFLLGWAFPSGLRWLERALDGSTDFGYYGRHQETGIEAKRRAWGPR